MAGKLIIFHGLPGSGKSTMAEKMAKSDPANTVLLNRDDMRTELFTPAYHKRNPDRKSEAEVSRRLKELLETSLQQGKTVIDDNTNLNPKYLDGNASSARKFGAEIEQIYVDVPVEECKKRNKKRGASGGREVPEHVIDRMAEAGYGRDGHIKDFIIHGDGRVSAVEKTTPGMKKLARFNQELEIKNPIMGSAIVLVDVDGTLAMNHHEANRAFGRANVKKDFDYFFRSIKDSQVNPDVVALANRMRANDGLNIVVLTGREDTYADELTSFLRRSGLNLSRVIAKREGDYRPDNLFKKEQLDRLRTQGFALVHSIDDRERSVRIYESEGIMVSRVEEHHPVDPSVAPKNYPTPKVSTIYGSGYCIRCGKPLKDKSKNIGPTCAKKI